MDASVTGGDVRSGPGDFLGNLDQVGFTPGEEDELLKGLGRRMRELRCAAGLSQRQLGVLTGLDNSKIAKIEKGKVNITFTTLCEICKGLSVPVNEFLRF